MRENSKVLREIKVLRGIEKELRKRSEVLQKSGKVLRENSKVLREIKELREIEKELREWLEVLQK
ncbi:hypothetical protein [uncultured Psychrobacillus sp.]|uniref:hypothetical protein n=1 Tax=uncultured Psychrobacillus sp. TaxID=1551585 RepID=UPI002629E72A|nr:hypothetical protein [uncultured Psychrobacillus sp.]